MRYMTLLMILTAVVWITAPILDAQSNVPAGDSVKGKATYMKVGCFTCHGTVGQGGLGGGARLTPPALNTAGFINYVRKGGQRGGGGMPAFGVYALSDSDLADIRAYLASIPAPPPVKSIPILND